jgi:hypothetical protein
VHTSAEKDAPGVHREAGINRAASACAVFTLFLNKKHWPFVVGAAFSFGAVYPSAEKEALGFITAYAQERNYQSRTAHP